jgi:DedD protein
LPTSTVEQSGENSSAINPVLTKAIDDVGTNTTLMGPAIDHPVKKHKKMIAKVTHVSKIKPVNLSYTQIEKLNSTAWVIQMGNFKDTNNARRLADKLRVSGYKVFTKQIKSAQGHMSTRVYIGPELQRSSALHLADKIEQETKIRGIVINMKPLEI